MNFFLYLLLAWIFFLAFSLAWFFFWFSPHPPPPHHFSNGPSLSIRFALRIKRFHIQVSGIFFYLLRTIPTWSALVGCRTLVLRWPQQTWKKAKMSSKYSLAISTATIRRRRHAPFLLLVISTLSYRPLKNIFMHIVACSPECWERSFPAVKTYNRIPL